MKNVLIFLSVVAIIGLAAGVDYCHMHCKDYITGNVIPHIGCYPNKFFDNYNCPRNAKLVKITDPLKNMITDAHNAKRNFIAGGGDRNHSPACRMATMQWNNELAYLAALNVLKCQMWHDQCHNTNAFQYSGQSVAKAMQYPPRDFQIAAELRRAVAGWYAEVENSTQYFIDSYPKYYSGPDIGHFTVMMAERNTHVGCAAAVYTENYVSYFSTVCNYATTNMVDHPIYTKCYSGGEHCKTNRNQRYHNLCSAREMYDVNRWY